MKLAAMIDLVRNGTLEAVWWVEQESEQARVAFISQDIATHDPDALLKSLVEEEGDTVAGVLMVLVMIGDSRVCPLADEHRFQWKYDPGMKVVLCDKCITMRKESYQANRAIVEPVVAAFLDLPMIRTSRQ